MIEFFLNFEAFYANNIVKYLQTLHSEPIKLITLIIDLLIVVYLLYKFVKIARDTRAWQLLKGIFILIVATGVTKLLNLYILSYILNYFMTYIVIILIVIFQPELRRALEQIGTNKLSKYFGIEKDIETKTKESIYKIVIAVLEMSKQKTGALIVFERDIRLNDVINTGIEINAEISPQLLVNIFCTKTPLHDGAVIIKDNLIKAAACMLPLSNDRDIEKKYGTRHRAAIGITAESDSIVIVVSEETGKISVTKDGKMITDVDEAKLKEFLLSNFIL